jgi:major type 1 subunit fimbrin (pilin)
MKKTLVSGIIFSMLGLVASSSFAAAPTAADQGGKIDFVGKIQDATCTIDAADTDMTVTLPTVGAKSLGSAGATTGSTSFVIKVKDCPTTVKKIAAHFEAKLNMDPATLNLKQTATTGAATNVQVQLIDVVTGKQIPVGSTGSSFDLTTDATSKLGVGQMTYAAQYYATGAATSGVVASQTQYTLAYP